MELLCRLSSSWSTSSLAGDNDAEDDKDGDGGISLEEFIEMNISRNKRQNPQISVDRRSQADILQEKAKLAFNAYDRNRDGYLTKAQC